MEVMSLRNLGFDPNLLETLHDLLDISDEQNQQSYQAPSRRYVREAKAMAATPADVKETKDAYVFVVDVPGLRPDMINVKIEEDNVLVVSGERKREKERDQGIKYLRMERRLGKYLKKFVLPDNADIERISAECQDGVLTVTVAKKPPPKQKKPKTIQIQISSNQGGGQGGKGGQGWEEGGEEERGKQSGGQGWEEGGQEERGRQGRGQGGQGGGQGGKVGQGWEEGGQEERGRQGGEQGGEHGRQGGQSGGKRGAGGYEGQVEGREK
ncbi:17.1 kDa class II heat shock protein-like [Pyrus x bretschneideri]|uniref:17.1 kDa class II heat shock protein-like n=1 Tax=Pyrus x bretschneideri TaxID=225117 RepID=UPI0020309076|nr:17.1 kDa class II heat shock protein-like [Pyrus x bretschneideri]